MYSNIYVDKSEQIYYTVSYEINKDLYNHTNGVGAPLVGQV